MLTKRIIPCLDVSDGRVVKGVQLPTCATPATRSSWPSRYNLEGIDELVFLDITATLENAAGAWRDTIGAVAQEIFIPLTVGGGIRSEEDADAAVEAGADKVSLNTAALTDPSLITDARQALRQPGGDRGDRRQAAWRPLRRVRAQRHVRRRSRRRRVGARRPRRTAPARSC